MFSISMKISRNLFFAIGIAITVTALNFPTLSYARGGGQHAGGSGRFGNAGPGQEMNQGFNQRGNLPNMNQGQFPGRGNTEGVFPGEGNTQGVFPGEVHINGNQAGNVNINGNFQGEGNSQDDNQGD